MKKWFYHFDRFHEEEIWLYTAKLLRIGLFSWFLLNTLLLLPYHAQVWSPNAYVYSPAPSGDSYVEWVTDFLAIPEVGPYYLWFVFGQILCLILGILGYRPLVMTPLIFFFTKNLASRSGIILDGGNNLSELLLIYMMFMNTSGRPIELQKWPVLRSVAIAVSNLAMALCRFQIFVLYLSVGWFKLNGELWQSGMALYYILQSQEYSHPTVAQFVVQHPLFSWIGTYFTVFFQAAFPFLVWPRSTRPWILMAGVLLHLNIAFVMGLFTFGLVMCVSYIAFFPDDWSRSLFSRDFVYLPRKLTRTLRSGSWALSSR